MSDQQNQEEPSMEEILASIRRIISEDDPEEGQEEKAEGEAEAETAAEPEPEPEPEAPAEDPVEDDEEDELELTEKVNADGSAFDEAGESEVAEEAPEPKPIFDEDETPEPEPEPEPAELEAVEEEAPAEEAPVEEVSEDLDVALELDDDLLAEPDDNEESLISEPTQVAASSALSEIARAAITQRALAIGEGRTLEDLVREALRPELKHWLDAHLASMVERIVREEIKKMVRRVENQ